MRPSVRLENPRHHERLGKLFLFLALGFFGPTCLILIGAIPFAYRFHVLLLATGGLAIYSRWRGFSLRQLGIRNDTLRSSIIANTTLSCVLAALLLIAYSLHLIRAPSIPSWSLFFPIYVFVFCPAQEFSFRSVMFAELTAFDALSDALRVAISAVAYAFAHAIYWDPLVVLVTLAMGWVWGSIYLRYPNFLGVTISHAVLGGVSILVGLV
jgi:uncharacterized protein